MADVFVLSSLPAEAAITAPSNQICRARPNARGKGGSYLDWPLTQCRMRRGGWVGANRQSPSLELAAEITVITPDSDA